MKILPSRKWFCLGLLLLLPALAFAIFCWHQELWGLSQRDRAFHVALKTSDHLSVEVHHYGVHQSFDEEPFLYDLEPAPMIGSFTLEQFKMLLPVQTQSIVHTKTVSDPDTTPKTELIFQSQWSTKGRVWCSPDGTCTIGDGQGNNYLLTPDSAQRFRLFLQPLLKRSKINFK